MLNKCDVSDISNERTDVKRINVMYKVHLKHIIIK